MTEKYSEVVKSFLGVSLLFPEIYIWFLIRHTTKQISYAFFVEQCTLDIQNKTGAEYLHVIAYKFCFASQIKNQITVFEKKIKHGGKDVPPIKDSTPVLENQVAAENVANKCKGKEKLRSYYCYWRFRDKKP